MLKLKQYHYYIAYFLIAVFAFYQFVFFIHPPKYDIIDCYYPWRYYIGECLQNHKFPFWNPYQDLGYPIHADPSSGTWYPFVWIIGYFFGYNIYTIGLEIWIHVFIAGIGFYKLCKTLKTENDIAFIAGISYMLCGIFVGNPQHITYFVSACWITFILNYYLKMNEEANFLNSLKAGFFMFLILTGGYPAFTFILFYLLLIFFFYFLIKKIRVKEKVSPFLLYNFLFFTITILLSAGIIVSVYQVMPYLSRTNGFDVSKALFCPFSPQSTISFLLPFAVIKNIIFFQTDLAMTNGYFGIFFFIFFIIGLFTKKSSIVSIFFGFALFALLASFGRYTPVREFLFDYVPLMNLFRFPSTFRLFVIIGFILVAVAGLNHFVYREFENKKKMVRVLLVFISLFVLVIIVCRANGYLSIVDFIKHDLFCFSKTSTILQHIAFQAGIQITFLFAFLIVVLKIKKTQSFLLFTALLVFLDLFVSAQLNAPYTVYYQEFLSTAANHHIKKFPSGFPALPDNTIASTDPHEVYFEPFWKNVNIFQKQVSSEGFNSFSFSGREALREETPNLYTNVINNKIVYLSDELHAEPELNTVHKYSLFTGRSLFFEENDFNKLKSTAYKNSIGDSAQLVYFKPDSFIVNTGTSEKQILTLIQNNYKGWHASINNEPTEIYTSNQSLISVVLPAGKNTISFVYKDNSIKIAAFVSVSTLLLLLTTLIVYSKKSRFKNG